jgi:hypothetical protein
MSRVRRGHTLPHGRFWGRLDKAHGEEGSGSASKTLVEAGGPKRRSTRVGVRNDQDPVRSRALQTSQSGPSRLESAEECRPNDARIVDERHA